MVILLYIAFSFYFNTFRIFSWLPDRPYTCIKDHHYRHHPNPKPSDLVATGSYI